MDITSPQQLVPGNHRLVNDIDVSLMDGVPLPLCDDLDIDLNGFTVRNTAGPGNSAIAFHSPTPRNNVTIRNGKIEGFYASVHMKGDRLRASRLEFQSWYLGVYFDRLDGGQSSGEIMDCVARSVGGTTREGDYTIAIAFANYCRHATTRWNSIHDVFGRNEAVGISHAAPYAPTPFIAQGDASFNRIIFASLSPRRYGIWHSGQGHWEVEGNLISNAEHGITAGDNAVVGAINNDFCNVGEMLTLHESGNRAIDRGGNRSYSIAVSPPTSPPPPPPPSGAGPLIPIMTGPTTNGVTLSADTVPAVAPYDQIWKLGDGVASTYVQWNAYGARVIADFGVNKKRFSGCEIGARGETGQYGPKSFAVMGGDDLSSLTTLYTKTNEDIWAAGQVRPYSFPESADYRYGVIQFTDGHSPPPSTYEQVGTIQLIGQ